MFTRVLWFIRIRCFYLQVDCSLFLFVIGEHWYSTLSIFISVFNYICLTGCGPQEMPRCWHVGGLGKLSTFCLTDREFNQFFYGDSFCFLLQNANGRHWYAATTGRQPVENNKNKESLKYQGDMIKFYDLIQVFVLSTNHHPKMKILNQVVHQLTHLSLASYKWDRGKQCRSRCDTASSGSSLFA